MNRDRFNEIFCDDDGNPIDVIDALLYGDVVYEGKKSEDVCEKKDEKPVAINNSKNNISIEGGGSVSNSNNTIQNIDNSKFIKYDNSINTEIIYEMPKEPINAQGRDIITKIYDKTGTKYHMFTGFVNTINYKKSSGKRSRAIIYNVFWNDDVYISDHIVCKDNLSIIEVGDFIEFKGKLQWYDRENGSEATSIDIVEITKIIHPKLKIHVPNDSLINDTRNYNDILYTTPPELLYRFYKIQINKINEALQYDYYLRSEMFISLLERVFYEGTKDHEMIKNELKIDKRNISPGFVKLACFVRYLVYDCGVRSPFVVYLLLCYKALDKNESERINNIFYKNIDTYVNRNIDNIKVSMNRLMNGFYIYMCNYIEIELQRIFTAYRNK